MVNGSSLSCFNQVLIQEHQNESLNGTIKWRALHLVATLLLRHHVHLLSWHDLLSLVARLSDYNLASLSSVSNTLDGGGSADSAADATNDGAG